MIKRKIWHYQNKENRIIFISDKLAKELFKLRTLQNANKIANSELYYTDYDFMFCNEFETHFHVLPPTIQ